MPVDIDSVDESTGKKRPQNGRGKIKKGRGGQVQQKGKEKANDKYNSHLC